MLTRLDAIDLFREPAAPFTPPPPAGPPAPRRDAMAASDDGFRRFARWINDSLNGGSAEQTTELIQDLEGRLALAAPEQRDSLLQALLNLSDRCSWDQEPTILSTLAQTLCGWVRGQGRLTPLYGKACISLQSLGKQLIARHRLADANQILLLFNHIYSGVMEKDDSLRAFSGGILKGFGTDLIVDQLVTEFRTNAHNQCREAGRGMVLLGAAGVGRILPILQESDDKFERLRFLEVVAEMGPVAAQTMVVHLRESEPWYFTRNLLQVLGRVGDESHVEVLTPLLTHGDGRVCREAIDTLYKIGGSKREEVILAMLHLLDDPLKIRAVAILGSLRSRKALAPLLAMVGGRARIWDRMRRELDLAICHALGKIGAPEAIPVLTELAERKRAWGRNANARLAAAARCALREISPSAEADPSPSGDAVAVVDHSRNGKNAAPWVHMNLPAKDLSAKIKAEIAEFLRLGNTRAAVKILYENVQALVQQKRFDEAEALRRSMIAIDPLAFNAIVKSGAQIESARHAAIDPEHLALWQALYQGLALSEANGFYYALKERHFSPGEALISQGRTCDCLYFINRGTVETLFERKGGVIQLNTLRRGEIGGYETFFHHTVATSSLVAAEPVAASCLHRRALAQRDASLPHITPKLHDFCLRHLKRSDLWRRKSIDRRTQRRITLVAPIKLRIPDAQGRGLHIAYRGQLMDLSVGGALLRVRLSRGDRTRLLVGHPVLLELAPPLADAISPSRKDALIVAVRPHLLNEHFLQIQFVDTIKLSDFLNVEKLIGSP